MKKRALAVLLSACMLAAAVPYPTFAADAAAAGTTGTAAKEEPAPEDESAMEEETAAEEAAAEESDTRDMDDMTESDNNSLTDSDTLFAEYADRQFEISSGEEIRRAPRRNRFSGQNGIVYDKLKSAITDIANGMQSSAVISIPVSELLNNGQVAYTRSELGLGEDAKIEDGYKALLAMLDVDNSAVYDALLNDLPYDLYWLDKTRGTSMGEKGSYGYSEGKFYFGDDYAVIFQLPVSADYSIDGTAGEYETDTAKTSAASAAAQNARNIVSSETGDSDNAVLADFKDKICSLVSYNTDVASDSNTNYGNPWQLIYVFDDDPATNVVCEGYAKAFKYLCDLYKTNHGFTDSSLDVYTVTDVMQGGTGAGRHMWNMVQTSDGNLLADITNSDEGTIGKDGSLFMVIADDYSTDSSGRTTGYTAGKVTYVYDSDMLDQYDEDEIGFNNSYDSHKEYAVNLASAANGEVSADRTSAVSGETVILTVSPETGYELDSLVVRNGTDSIKVTNSGNGTYTFAMPAGDITVTASFKKSVVKVTNVTITPFTVNMTVGDEAALQASVQPDNATDKTVTWTSDNENVATVNEQGIVTALLQGTAIITATANDGSGVKGELAVTVLHNKYFFTDVTDPGNSYYDAIYWAADKGITTGYSDGTFGVSKNCSRGAFVTFLWRQQGSPEPTLTAEKSGLKDFNSIGKSYQKAVLWAVEEGITTGYKDKTFRAGTNVTRGAAVTFLWRAAGQPKISTNRSSVKFTDMVPAGSSYETGILWAVENNITTGYKNNTFRPGNKCTRGATVTFLQRFDGLK